MNARVSIPGKYNGPPTSANGGYCCGIVAAAVEGPARVRLLAPPPLDQPLEIQHQHDRSVQLLSEQAAIGQAWPGSEAVVIPQPPTLEQAREASAGYVGFSEHAYPGCYVCGPGRPDADGMDLFPGRVSESEIYATPWKPKPDQLRSDGTVGDEFVWAALDCPGYFAAFGDDTRPALLGELYADLREPVPGDAELVVFAWAMETDGRKRRAGTAVADGDGCVLAVARATWIELRD